MQPRILCLLCAILVTIAARASTTVSVPNTFVAGTPAKAADVNANFAALVNGINSIVTPPIVEDSAGHVVGPYLLFGNAIAGGMISGLSEGVFLRTSAVSFVVQINSQGFISNGTLGYTTPDCTGTAYVIVPNTGYSQPTLIPYAIVLNTTAYSFQWSAATSVSIASVFGAGGQCAPPAAPAPNFGAPVVAMVDLSALGFVPPFSVR